MQNKYDRMIIQLWEEVYYTSTCSQLVNTFIKFMRKSKELHIGMSCLKLRIF